MMVMPTKEQRKKFEIFCEEVAPEDIKKKYELYINI